MGPAGTVRDRVRVRGNDLPRVDGHRAVRRRGRFWSHRRNAPDLRIAETACAQKFLGTVSDHWIAVFATGSLACGALRKLCVPGVSAAEHAVVTASEFQTRDELVERAVQRGCELHCVNRPQRVLCVGDGTWDLKTARHLGHDFLGIGTGAKADQLTDLGAVVHEDLLHWPQVATASNHACRLVRIAETVTVMSSAVSAEEHAASRPVLQDEEATAWSVPQETCGGEPMR